MRAQLKENVEYYHSEPENMFTFFLLPKNVFRVILFMEILWSHRSRYFAEV